MGTVLLSLMVAQKRAYWALVKWEASASPGLR